MSQPDALDLASDGREPLLRALVEGHPEAVVTGFDATAVIRPLPDALLGQAVRVPPGHDVIGLSALDLVVPSDRARVLLEWERVNLQGTAEIRANLVFWDRPAHIMGFDFRARHGLSVLVAWAEDHRGNVVPERREGRATPLLGRASKDAGALVLSVDAAAQAMLGWRADQMVGKRSLEFVHPADQAVAVDSWYQMLANQGPPRRARLRHLCADGSWKWLEIINHNLLGQPGQDCIVADMVDISEEMEAWEAVREREQLLGQLAQALPVGVLHLSCQGEVLYANERLAQVLGMTPHDRADLEQAAGESRQELSSALDEVLQRGSDAQLRVPWDIDGAEGAPGSLRQCEWTMKPLTSAAGEVTGAVACVADVTESMRFQQELEHHARTDDLTGCANRRAAMRLLEEVLGADGTLGTAVVFVDLDSFKRVNDSLGHAAGDELLAAVATRLCRAVRAVDTVGRVGGDEFLVVCPGVGSFEQAAHIGSRLASALCGSFAIGQELVESRASVGTAWTACHSVGADELVKAADAAMYQAKAAGAGPVAVSV